MTYQNIGYWIGQANDTSTGRHPTGWTNGQRWSETAGEWIPMYDSMVFERDTYYNGQQYWQHTVAHNDPNVWTNQYNAGYSAADIAESPRAFSIGQASNFTGMGQGAGNWATVTLNGQSNTGLTFFANATTISTPRSGRYVISVTWLAPTDAGWQGLRLHRGGSTSIGQAHGNTSAQGQIGGGSQTTLGFSCVVDLSAGELITMQGYKDNNPSSSALFMAFIPTPANPQ